MGLWDLLLNRVARWRAADADAALKLARNSLAIAFDDEAERLNGGKALGYGHLKTDATKEALEAQEVGSFIRKLDPDDPRIEEALKFQEAGLLTPLTESARKVLAEPWPGGFDAEAKFNAAMKALHESRES